MKKEWEGLTWLGISGAFPSGRKTYNIITPMKNIPTVQILVKVETPSGVETYQALDLRPEMVAGQALTITISYDEQVELWRLGILNAAVWLPNGAECDSLAFSA
jgi:hypothetical protein